MISHNVQPNLKAIVERFQQSSSISEEKLPLGEGLAWLAQAKFDEYSTTIKAQDGSQAPLDTDPRTDHVELRQGDDTASYHLDASITKFQFSGPGWVGFGEKTPSQLRYVEAKSEGNTVTAEAYYQDNLNPENSFQQQLEYTAKAALRP